MTTRPKPAKAQINNGEQEKGGGFLRNFSSLVRSWAGFKNLWNTGQKRDIEREFGHPEFICAEDYWFKFDRGDVANRAIAIYPEECFKEPPQIYETEDAELDTDFEKALEALNDELHFSSVLMRADVLSGIGRYGVILLGLNDGLTLDQPVAGFPLDGAPSLTGAPITGNPALNAFPPSGAKPTAPAAPAAPPFQPPQAAPKPKDTGPAPKPKLQLMYLRTFDESMVTIIHLEKDVRNPRFGQPIQYRINFFDDNAGTSVSGPNTIFGPVPSSSGANKTPQPADMPSTKVTLTVHWTRVIHLADNRLRDEIFGVPRMKKIFDRVLDVHKIVGGSAEMFYKGANLGISLETLPPQPGEPAPIVDKDATKQELEEYYEGLKRFMVLDGMTAKPLGVQVADPTAASDTQLKLICAAIGCPMRVFMGSEEGRLASNQDMITWNERLQKRRLEYLTPFVIRPFIDRLIKIGVLPFPKGKGDTSLVAGQDPRPDYTVHWDPLNSATATEEAAIALQQTQAMAQYVQGGLDQLITPKMFLTLILKFTQDEAEAIIDEVGDNLFKTDPEAEHQMALDKIQATAAARQLNPPPPGTPGAPGTPAPRRGAVPPAPAPAKNEEGFQKALEQSQLHMDKRFQESMAAIAALKPVPPINLNMEVKMPEGKPVKKSFKIERQNGQFHGTIVETPNS